MLTLFHSLRTKYSIAASMVSLQPKLETLFEHFHTLCIVTPLRRRRLLNVMRPAADFFLSVDFVAKLCKRSYVLATMLYSVYSFWKSQLLYVEGEYLKTYTRNEFCIIPATFKVDAQNSVSWKTRRVTIFSWSSQALKALLYIERKSISIHNWW